MNWNDLQAAWKTQEPAVDAQAELATLLATFEKKHRSLARRLFWRDIREAAAGLVVAVFFVYKSWRTGNVNWAIGVAVVVVLAVTAFFVRERFRARKASVGADAPLLDKLNADIAELRHQHRLLLNVGKWYLAPLVAAWALVMIERFVHRPELLRMRNYQIYLGFSFVLFWGIWRLNRWGAQKKLAPRLAALERLRDHLVK